MQGPEQHTFAELLASSTASVIRFEATGQIGPFDPSDIPDMVRAAVARGVRIRRVRIVSEPVSEYIRWEHACTDVNVQAGEDICWLPHADYKIEKAWRVTTVAPGTVGSGPPSNAGGEFGPSGAQLGQGLGCAFRRDACGEGKQDARGEAFADRVRSGGADAVVGGDAGHVYVGDVVVA
jgi:hypothetical protein